MNRPARGRERRSAWYGVDTSTTPPTIVAATVDARGAVRTEQMPPTPELLGRLASGWRTSAALPPRKAVLTWLALPMASRAKSRRVLPALLDLKLPFPLDECTYTFVPARATDSRDVLAMAARSRDLQETLVALGRLNLDAERLLPPAKVLWDQAQRELPARAAAARALILMGDRQDLLVLGRGGRYEATCVSSHDDPSRIALAVRSLLGTDATPDLEWWFAGPAATPDAVAAFRQRVPICRAAPDPIVDRPACFLARALATDGLLHGPREGNLRGGDQEHPLRKSETERRPWIFAGALAAAALLLIATAAIAMHGAERRDAASRAELADTLETLAGYRITSRGSRAIDDALKAFEERLDPRLVTRLESSGLDLLTRVWHVLQTEAATVHALELKGGTLTLEVSMPAAGELARLRSALATAGLSSGLTPVDGTATTWQLSLQEVQP